MISEPSEAGMSMRRFGRTTAVLGMLALCGGVVAVAPVSAEAKAIRSVPRVAVAAPAVRSYFGDLPGFGTASSVPVKVTFDDLAPGASIEGATLAGATFSHGPQESAPPIVSRAADTYTTDGFTSPIPFDPADNTLIATSGANVLSPGGPALAPGPNPSVENDDLVVHFDHPMSAVGFDLLFQSLDAYSGVAVSLLDPSGAPLYTNSLIPSGSVDGGGPGAPWFVGFVSPAPNIATLVIDETDDNVIWPDANIGFDTFRFGVLRPTVVPGSAAVAEGNSGTTATNVPVALSTPSDQTVTVEWTTLHVPGAPADQADPTSDYTPTSGTVTFAAGETSKTVAVTVNSDTLVEPDEYLVVSFHDPTNAMMGGFWGLGFGIISNDDHARVLPGVASVGEGNGGITTLEVPVTLSNPSTQTVTVQWTTLYAPGAAGDQADPATDYTPVSGTVTFAPGETSTTVSVTVNGDTATEPDEYLVLSFHDPTNAMMGGFWGLGFGVITNDD